MTIHKKRAVSFLTALLFLALTACTASPDADVLFREAKTNAGAISNCTATYRNDLAFTANGKKFSSLNGNEIVYRNKPFALKSSQTAQTDGKSAGTVTYTVADSKGLWFYSDTGNGWQKTSAGNIDTTPGSQIDILRLLTYVKSEKYVRDLTLNSKRVQKLELTFQNEVLRSTIEAIVTSTGMGDGSKTIVQTLLDSAEDVYGYCYIDVATGEIARIELDATTPVNTVFKNIDGSSVSVNITKCVITGDIDSIGKAPAVELPPQAAAAQSVEAAG
jgi:hypothetical protein